MPEWLNWISAVFTFQTFQPLPLFLRHKQRDSKENQGGNRGKQSVLVSVVPWLSVGQGTQLFPHYCCLSLPFLLFSTIRRGNISSFLSPVWKSPLDYEKYAMGSSFLNVSRWQLSPFSVFSTAQCWWRTTVTPEFSLLHFRSLLWLLAPTEGYCLHSCLPFPETGLNHPQSSCPVPKENLINSYNWLWALSCLCHLGSSICLLSSIAAVWSIESNKD